MVYQQAAGRLIPVQLEMGGKNAAIVCRTADLTQAAEAIVSAALLCSGQRCTAISRVLVQEEKAEELADLLEKRMRSVKVGPGLEEGVQMGPLINESQLQQVDNWVKKGKDEGAKVRCGGERLVGPDYSKGHFYSPTLLTEVNPEMEVACEEIFGPVVTLTKFRDIKEAIRIANDVKYGLSAAIFTKDLFEADEFCEKVESGMVHVNQGTFPQSHLPFGGVKESGVGAYSVGASAIEFFTTIKTVYRQRC